MAIRLNRSWIFWAGVLLLLSLSVPVEAHNGAVAIAVPVEGIVIDGDLSDWPEGMRRYAIELPEPAYGVRPKDEEDFRGSFRIGFNEQEKALYIAVEVQDESVVIDSTGTWNTQDGCEIYVAAEKYVIFGTYRREGSYEVEVKRTESLHRYEWRIDIDAMKGKVLLGMDIVVEDKDTDGSFSWMVWGRGKKKWHTDSQGDLVLIQKGTEIGRIRGKITWKDMENANKHGMVRIQSLISEDLWLEVRSDQQGEYEVDLPAGTYALHTSSRGVRKQILREKVEVDTGGEVVIDVVLDDLGSCFFVDDDAPKGGDGSRSRPFRTIQKAMESTSEGDTVKVAAGTYTDPVELLSGVKLLGAGPDSTFIDGEGQRGPLVRIEKVQHVVLEGFAIVRGQGIEIPISGFTVERYGGLYVNNVQHVRIARNLIAGHVSVDDGGGIACFNCDSTVVIGHNLIVGNESVRSSRYGDGGGIYMGRGSRARVEHNTVVYNRAKDSGGGIFCQDSSPYLHDNIVAFNLNGGIAFKRYGVLRETPP